MATKKKRIAVYPGSFDPPTNGHLSLIERASQLFDQLIVAVAMNSDKNSLFSVEERVDIMQQSVARLENAKSIKVISFEGLTARLADDLNAQAIIRGLRAVSDFEYEFQMALMNRKLARDVETVFLMPALSWVYLSSSLVKDVANNHGDITDLVPAPVKKALKKKLKPARK